MASPDSSKTGWRGKRGERMRQEMPRHRWQTGRSVSEAGVAVSSQGSMWRRFRLPVLGLTALILLVMLLMLLLYVPSQTPVLAVVATPYDMPLPPNAWAWEDLQRLANLDGQSIRLTDVSPAWRSKARGLRDLEQHLKLLVEQRSRSDTVVLYISMHGVVDGQGRACLVPPGASPLKSETWLSVQELFESIKDQGLPDHWHKLVVFDANRITTDWQMGVLYNSFTEALEAAVEQAEIPGLVVLNSASAGQTGWASHALGGSAFGYYFAKGLAGAADDPRSGGDGNRQVTLRELEFYLAHHVDQWALFHRAESQRPTIFPENARDFQVAWALRSGTQRRLFSGDNASPPSIAPSRISRLWKTHDQLLAARPERFDPLAWRDWQQQLLWLEKASLAGEAYKSPSGRNYVKLAKDAEAMTTRLTAADAAGRDLFAHWQVFNTVDATPPSNVQAYSLSLAEYLGQIPAEKIQTAEGILTALRESPNPAGLQQAVEALNSWDPDQKALLRPHFLRTVERYQSPSLWARPELFGRTLLLQGMCETTAIPWDERAQYWIRDAVTQADHGRRQVEDRLFVSADDPDLDNETWHDANELLRAARLEESNMETALRTRDAVWADLPYLARWIARPLRPQQNSEPYDREVNTTLLELVELGHVLGTTLASPATDENEGDSSIDELVTQAQGDLDRLKAVLQRQAERLADSKRADPRGWRDIQAALDVPLVAAATREALYRQFIDWDKQFHTSFDEPPLEQLEHLPPREITAQPYLERVSVLWREHPALPIVDRNWQVATAATPATEPEPSDDAADENAEQPADAGPKKDSNPAELSVGNLLKLNAAKGEQLRQRLAAVPRLVARQESLALAAEGDSPLQLRSAWAEAERILRTSASLGCPAPADDPIVQLRRFDLQQLLLWHAERALHDFWGRSTPQDQPLFALAAGNYLTAARQMFEVSPAVQRQMDDISADMNRLLDAADHALTTSASDVLMTGAAIAAKTTATVAASSSGNQAGLHSGTAALFLRDSQGPLPDALQALPLPQTWSDTWKVRREFPLLADEVSGRGPMAQAVTLYRGHEFAGNFLLRAPGGIKIDFSPFEYGPPQVTLSGSGRRQASVIFVLDCSNSMKELTEVETAGERRVPRLDVARSALLRMMERLADQQSARVGVRFYGHRVGWNTSRPEELMRQTNYGREIPDTLRPSDDVEVILPLGRFDPSVAAGVAELAATLRPWGESPLYLALVESVAELAADDSPGEKTIVVITDGLNYQFNADSPTRLNDVLSAVRGQNIPIHIVGLGIAENEQAEARREFGDLASATGGSYVPAENATSLVRSLDQLLQEVTWRLSDNLGGTVGETDLGRTITVRPGPTRPRNYTVACDRAVDSIELAGGEAAELVLSSSGARIESLPYLKGNPRFGRLQGPSSAEAIFGVHRPLWSDEGVLFNFSFQHANRLYTPRPREVWITVKPLVAESEPAPRYFFYDTHYQPATPVPVLEWLATDWPVSARQAEVSVWSKNRITPPSAVASLGDLLDKQGEPQALPDIPDAYYQVQILRSEEGLRIGVVERHGARSPGLGSVKVELFPQPDRIVRRFDERFRLATHTFYYPEVDNRLLATFELRFTTHDALAAEAEWLPEPLVVNIAESGDLLRVTPPAPLPEN